MIAALPSDEAERLNALHRYEVYGEARKTGRSSDAERDKIRILLAKDNIVNKIG
jgi:hypothetical protein